MTTKSRLSINLSIYLNYEAFRSVANVWYWAIVAIFIWLGIIPACRDLNVNAIPFRVARDQRRFEKKPKILLTLVVYIMYCETDQTERNVNGIQMDWYDHIKGGCMIAVWSTRLCGRTTTRIAVPCCYDVEFCFYFSDIQSSAPSGPKHHVCRCFSMIN